MSLNVAFCIFFQFFDRDGDGLVSQDDLSRQLPIKSLPVIQVTYNVMIQWNPSITDTTGTNDFVLYSKVSFAQGGDC